MFKIFDGREQFWQWDLNQKLIVFDPAITEVHFCNKTDECSLVCEVYDEVGLRVVNVPNIILQDDWDIRAYASTGDATKIEQRFKVLARTKPADYAYTETEVKNYDALEARIEALEDGSEASVDLSDYYTKKEVNDLIPDVNDFATKDEIPTVSVATANTVGMVKPDNVTTYINSDGSISVMDNIGGGSSSSGGGWVWEGSPYYNSFYLSNASECRMIKLSLYINDHYKTTVDICSSIGFDYQGWWYFPWHNDGTMEFICIYSDPYGHFNAYIQDTETSVQITDYWVWRA